MTNEAPEAPIDYSPAGIYLTAVKAGYSQDAAHALADLARNAHAAGVVEGFRQAQEAVASMSKVLEWCDDAGYDLRAILNVERLPDWLTT